MKKIVKPLINWYNKNKRSLPWRTDQNPYHIWISEIMLQQTRVEAVKPYFDRFISALPSIRDVAECPDEQLLKLWEGLGYYSRVRNIRKAAQILCDEYHGNMPKRYEDILALPGIGPYTAGAIASIAYDIPVPAVDGNVLRVYARLCEDDTDIMSTPMKHRVQDAFAAIMPKHDSGIFNQALMELGATICLPQTAPRCTSCPIKNQCRSFHNNTQSRYPVRIVKTKRKIEKRTIMVIRDGEQVALRKRPKTGLLAGMYELPNVEGELTGDEVVSYLEEQGLHPLHIKRLPKAKHVFSHITWQMRGYQIRVAALDDTVEISDFLFVDQVRAEEQYAIPAAFEAYVRYMNIRLGQKKYNEKEDEQ